MGRKWVYIIIAAVLVVILAVGGVVYYTNSNNYAAKVDGQKITKAEYQFFVSLVKAQVQSTFGITDMNQKLSDKTAGEFVKEGAFDSAVEYKIQLIKAKEKNVKLSGEEEKSINDYFDNTIAKNYGSTKLEQDTKIKADTGVTLDQYKKIFLNYQLTQKFKSEEAKNIKVSDEDVKKYYDENKDNIDSVTVRHILFLTQDKEGKAFSEDKKAEVKKKAEGMLARVNAGEDIKALAEQYSEDPGVKENKGEYSFYKNGQDVNGQNSYVNEFPEWAFKAKVGDTGIVTTTYGYHVIKLEKRSTFDERKDAAKSSLLSKKYTDQLDTWKKDAKFKPVKNDAVINSIKV